jgi:hypothetical protein
LLVTENIKGNLKIINVMVEEKLIMEKIFIKDNGKMVEKMGKELCGMKKVMSSSVNGNKA